MLSLSFREGAALHEILRSLRGLGLDRCGTTLKMPMTGGS